MQVGNLPSFLHDKGISTVDSYVPSLVFLSFFSFPSITSDSLFHFHLPWQWPTGYLVSVINQSPELEGIRG